MSACLLSYKLRRYLVSVFNFIIKIKECLHLNEIWYWQSDENNVSLSKLTYDNCLRYKIISFPISVNPSNELTDYLFNFFLFKNSKQKNSGLFKTSRKPFFPLFYSEYTFSIVYILDVYSILSILYSQFKFSQARSA